MGEIALVGKDVLGRHIYVCHGLATVFTDGPVTRTFAVGSGPDEIQWADGYPLPQQAGGGLREVQAAVREAQQVPDRLNKTADPVLDEEEQPAASGTSVPTPDADLLEAAVEDLRVGGHRTVAHWLINEHAPGYGFTCPDIRAQITDKAAQRQYGTPPHPGTCACGRKPDPGTKPLGGCYCVDDDELAAQSEQ